MHIIDLLFDANEKEIRRKPVDAHESCGCGSRTVLKLILPKKKTKTDRDVELGPIAIHASDTIASIEARMKVRGKNKHTHIVDYLFILPFSPSSCSYACVLVCV
jgi:hypothetical protein